MLIFDIIKKILINIITPPKAGNIRKLVKSPNEPLKESLLQEDETKTLEQEDETISDK
jgi:hypothetical protein